jgi:hypothetical protein
MIEFPNAIEPRAERYLTHRELRTFNQIECQMNALSGRNLKRGCAKVLDEQSSQLA